MAKAINSLRYPVNVLTLSQPMDHKYDKTMPFTVIRSKIANFKIFRVPALMIHIIRIVLKHPGIRVITVGWSPAGAAAFFASYIVSFKYATVAFGTELTRHPHLNRLLRIVFKKSKFVICSSIFTREYLLKLKCHPDNLKVINPGINLILFNNKDCPIPEEYRIHKKNGNFILLTVTRVIPKKGIDMVLKVLPDILKKHPNLHYFVIGTGNDIGRITKMIQELGLHDNVTLLGERPNETIRKYYFHADTYILPTRFADSGTDFEGFGIVFSEASACGCPVIAGNHAGVTDAVIEGTTGFLVEPKSFEDIFNALNTLISDVTLRNKIKEQAPELMRKRCDWNMIVKKIIREFNHS